VPTLAPSDNGAVVTLTAAIAPLSFTGTLNIAAGTGVITLGNAGPLGNYVITANAIDNCAASTQSPFNVAVGSDLFFSNGFETPLPLQLP
jgi:hypothetical protein